MENPMQNIRIEKLTLNVGAGKELKRLDKGVALLKKLTGIEPVKTFAKKRIPAWGLRPGLPIGCKITLRDAAAKELLPRLLEAKDNMLKPSQFDNSGNFSFGISEYIDIPGIDYDPNIGTAGFEVCVSLERPGYRIKKRRLMKKKIGKKHIISKEDAIEFMKNEFKITVGDAE